MPRRITIDPDIRRARTLPAEVYREPAYFAFQKERVFARSWQLVPGAGQVSSPGHALPWTLLEGCLDEPLVLTRDEAGCLRCLSNVCTHRGNLVVEQEGPVRGLRCRYHGRRFGLDGRFLSMPEFEGVEGFPSNEDDLPGLPMAQWGPFVFVSLDPAFPFEALIEPMRRRLDWVPFERFAFDPESSRDYVIEANWALYCDNYLEGFHIPYVHEGLASALDYGSYRTETYEYSSVQVATASPGEPVFDHPPSHPDRGKGIAAYYYWLFPNTMFNLYPWGLSVNVVLPLGSERTRISYLSYVWDESKRDRGPGAGLHRVELEDEAVVQNVQRGIRSRLYERGRYSPTREAGVHHFHHLLARFMMEDSEKTP